MVEGVDEVVSHPAFTAIDVISTIGAGDTFTAGFLYTLMQEGSSLKRACEVGCLAGAAVVQTLGSEVQESGWRWMNARMHGELAATVARYVNVNTRVWPVENHDRIRCWTIVY